MVMLLKLLVSGGYTAPSCIKTMDIIAGLGIGILLGYWFRKKRKNRTVKPGTPRKGKLSKADEELITVVLPTINNDK